SFSDKDGNGVPPTQANNVVGDGCLDPNSNPGQGAYICFNSAVGGSLYGTDPSGVPPFNAFSVVRNFRTPRAHNFNLSVQRELFRNNVLTIGYSGQRGRDLIIYYDLNASPIGSDCTSAADCDQFR